MVAYSGFVIRHAGYWFDRDTRRKIVKLYADQFADIAPLDPFDHFDIRGGITDLETNDYT